jgi:SAM-dependent methyltransferase
VSIHHIDQLVSPYYRGLLNQMHENFEWGIGGPRHIKNFIDHLNSLPIATFLDYGCGKGRLKHSLLAVDPSLQIGMFDPGNPKLDTLPAPADFVVALSCLENIEPDRVVNVLSHIDSLMKIGGYFHITTRSGYKNDLPDGRNEHLSVHEPEWWLDMIGGFHQFEWRISKHNAIPGKALQVWLTKPGYNR